MLTIDENATAAGVMSKNSALRTKRNGRAKLACVIIMILIYFIKILLWKSDLDLAVVDDFMNRLCWWTVKENFESGYRKNNFLYRSDV